MKIVQHCFGKDNSGGPIVSMKLEIKWSTRFFYEIRQTEPAKGLDLKLLTRFVSELKSMKPDLIHVRGLGNEGFHAVLAAWIAKVPHILLTIHGTQRDLQFGKNTLRRWIVINILENLTLRLSNHIATVCQYTAKRSFLAPFRHKLIGAIHNGVEIPDVNTSSKLDARCSLGISSSDTIAVCVSRITPEKGYYTLAQALRMLDGKVSSFSVFIVGGGDEDGNIREQFQGLTNINVRFTGHQEQVSQYLTISDFFILPSLHENHSIALLEAISRGLPAIASDVGGNTETLQDGGGILVPPSDPEALSIAIFKYISNFKLRSEDGIVARRIATEKYSAKLMAENWDAVYQSILKCD